MILEEFEMSLSTILLLVWFLLMVIGFVIMGNKNNKIKTKRYQIRQTLNNQEGFKPSHILIKFPYDLRTWIPEPIGIAIDDTSKQICLIDGESLTFIKYGDIIESEILAGGGTITKTSRGSQLAGAAVGGLLLGGVGAVIGGLSGKTVARQDIEDVRLKLLINDTSNPVHEIDFIDTLSNGQKTLPKIAMQEAQKWHALISVIIKQAEEKAESKTVGQTRNFQASFAEQISQLSELHKSGVLTDDEFSNAKNKLFNP